MRLGRLIALVLVAVVTAAVVPALAPAQLPDLPPLSGDPDPTAPPARETEPIVLTGQDFPNWSARSNVTARLPLVDLTKCQTFDAQCEHNHYAQPDFDTGSSLGTGAPVDKLLGYRWDGKGWHQIPFQVDEVFTRYLSNPASGFSAYSGEDQHTTYAYDREGFRWTESDPSNPCLAKPASPPAVDPVQGLDDNDELAFMASDSGGAAPAGTKPPTGIEGVRQVELRDPANPSAAPKYVYVMRAGDNGPKRTDQSYVTYKRDSISNTFEKSQSNYDSYGNAATGVYCDANGNIVRKADGTPDIQRRRPRDYATVKTSRYRFRYDGRWLLTQLHISPDGGKTFGPDLVDRWKARAFAQDRASETPCCGYEEEDNNWGGSSTLLGERSGPVRTIRETWGADSGTNVIRRETFYRDEMRMKTWLRVHVIPPLDGIYAQWDFNAGRVKTFYNSKKPAGVPIDGHNDEVFGNLDDPCNDNYNINDTGDLTQQYRQFYGQAM
ncbi:MAG: hypothetical protein QOE08_1061, partial [Thermoleophilaceae bacterium]|nr:hypothetical protein [Thermoleophilaceae bacterium]